MQPILIQSAKIKQKLKTHHNKRSRYLYQNQTTARCTHLNQRNTTALRWLCLSYNAADIDNKQFIVYKIRSEISGRNSSLISWLIVFNCCLSVYYFCNIEKHQAKWLRTKTLKLKSMILNNTEKRADGVTTWAMAAGPPTLSVARRSNRFITGHPILLDTPHNIK